MALSFELEGIRSSDDLTIDLYPVENPSHPDRHIGYWVFSSLEDGFYSLKLDLSQWETGTVRLFQDGEEKSIMSCWINPEGFFDPVIDFQMVLRRESRIEKIIHLILSLRGPEELERFYKKEGEGGTYRIDTLNLAFHKRRLRVLKRLFRKFVPKGRTVADLGSGIGFIKLLSNPYQYKVFCLDLHFPKIHRQGEDNVYYILGNVLACPFQDQKFDAVYSGEVIEHLIDPMEALRSWRRLLKDDGILVLTTPNIKRLINRARKYDLPLSKEHVNEMDLREAVELITKAGFRIRRRRGIYLELFLTWWRRQNIMDILQARLNRKAFIPLMKFLMISGYFFPSAALDMIIVAQKSDKSDKISRKKKEMTDDI